MYPVDKKVDMEGQRSDPGCDTARRTARTQGAPEPHSKGHREVHKGALRVPRRPQHYSYP